MNGQSTIRLLCVGAAPDDGEHVASLMRAAGYAVKPVHVDAADALQQALGNGRLDVALHVLSAPDLALEDTVAAIRERDLYVPVIAWGDGDLSPGRALASGAADRVLGADDEHLRHVIVREFERVLVRRRAHDLGEAYTESEQRAHALMESSHDAIAYIHDGMHVVANDAYLTRFGYKTFEEIEGMPMIDMVASGDQKKLKDFLRNFSTSEEAVGTLRLHLQQADGGTFEAEIEFSRASIKGEACSQIIIRGQNGAEEVEELEKQLTRLSQRDNVTGLYNRQHFMTLLQEALDAAGDEHGRYALVQLTLDNFASVKQRVGVLGADQVIADIAGVLQGVVGEDDALGRLDGATYALLTPTADAKALEALATRIRDAVRARACNVGGTAINTTATIGIARIGGDTRDPNDILSRAERALGEASETGPDAHRIYEPRKGELSQKQIDQQWVDRIKEMLKNDRLTLLYQPIVSLTGDSTARYEVLLRVIDDEGNAVDDPELLAAAARTGMSKGIDRWVVLNALKMLVEQLKQDESTVFFLPLSAHAFDDPGLFRWIHERLKAHRLPKGATVFQVDAAAAATRIKQASAFAVAAHKIGCGMALSGFGHGTDPFQVTHHVRVDYLRINEEFMQELDENTQNQDAIRQITSQARESELQTICGGVEDAATLSILWGLGVDMMLGEFLQGAGRKCSYDFSAMAM